MKSGRHEAGVCLHITALPGPYGIGELGQGARHFIDTMRRMSLSVWQFLPVGPTAYGDSPYQPLSTFAGNEMLIDIGNLIELGLLTADEAAPLAALPADRVDYGALIPLKSELLQLAASRFQAHAAAAIKEEFAAFVQQKNDAWLHDYALFRLLKSRHDERPWPEWAERYARRDPVALREIAAAEAGPIQITKTLQFLFFRQWSALRDYARLNGIKLFGDMPIYIALDSSDAWANRELLRVDENGRPERVAGVPPDYFSADGQLWGNPLYDWERHAADGYRWWVDRLRATAELVDLVRIDHFRGFESFWSIPYGETTARNGTWEPGPGDAIFDAIKNSLGSLPVIAEDLGVITPEVEALRDRHQLPGMRVLQFDICGEDFRLDDIGENSVCYTGTHDNDTTVGWFRGSPDDLRGEEEIRNTQAAALALTGGTAESVHTDLIRAACSTKAHLVIAPMQDYLGLGSEARFNTPGVAGGNWRWRLQQEQMSEQFCDNVASMINASGRGLANDGNQH